MKRAVTEGIPLRTLEYKEKERICTLYTEELGLISIILKDLSSKKAHLLLASTPFCIADYHTLKGRSDIYLVQDITIQNHLPSLKKSFAHLSAASQIALLLLSSQLPEKRSPQLYQLFKSFLLQLGAFEDPTLAVASFTLKLLLHEGVLSLREPPELFTLEEWHTLLPFALAKRFSQLPTAPLSPLLQSKLSTFVLQEIGV